MGARIADGSEPAVVALTQHGLEFAVISFHCIAGLFMFTIMFRDTWTFCCHLSLIWISCAWYPLSQVRLSAYCY